jgi:Raf kinase inhibitor-like YbhB/YbcL family protein
MLRTEITEEFPVVKGHVKIQYSTSVFLFLLLLGACDETPREEFEMRSGAFSEKEAMPKAYACGAGISPPLTFSGVPEEVKSLVVLLEDPDRVSGTYTHWMVWGLPPKVVLPADIETYPVEGAVMGTADDGKTVGYLAPCPPKGEIHRAVFRALGLDEMLDLEEGADRSRLDDALSGHIIAEAQLTAEAVGE